MIPDKKYYKLLKQIDALREQGVTNSDPKMMRLRMRLRDMLEHKKKRGLPKRKNSLVPRLKSVKTITFQSAEKDDKSKFVYLGVAVALGGLLYKLYRG